MLALLRNRIVWFVAVLVVVVGAGAFFVNSQAQAKKAATALIEVGLETRMNSRPSEMSGGEKQRVAIARAIAKDPSLLFADEPTSALDGENGQIVIKLLQRAAKQFGAAVVCVTHDPRLEGYADRVIHIEDGRILDDRRVTPSAAPIDPAHHQPAFAHPERIGA